MTSAQDKEMDDVIFGKIKTSPAPVPVDSEYVSPEENWFYSLMCMLGDHRVLDLAI